MEIRKAKLADIDTMMELFAMARRFMSEHGNAGQWGDSYPPEELLLADIESGCSYLCEDEGRAVGTFFYKEGPEPDYARIYEGAWLNEEPYSVVHRVAAPTSQRGVASFCMSWCKEQSGGNVRIETHRNNLPMQNMLAKNGFRQCGIVYVRGGSERIAYQWSA